VPGIGVGIFLLAVGAIMTFAVEVEAKGFNINTMGIILMIVGAFAVLLSLLFWSTLFGPRRETVVREEPHTVVHREDPHLH
jgi:hypothetical protein